MTIGLRFPVTAFLLIGAVGCTSLGGNPFGLSMSGSSPAVDPSAPEKLELPPQEGAKACLATAEVLEKAGKDYEASVMYERARNLDPSLVTLSRRLAVLYDRQGLFEKADQEYERAMNLYPTDADLWSDMGYSHYCRANWKHAEEAFRQAVSLQPTHQRAWVNLGMSLAQQSQKQEALKAFEQAVSPAQAHCNLGFVLATQGNKKEAIEQYELALVLAPELRLARIGIDKLSGNVPPSLDAGVNPKKDVIPAGLKERMRERRAELD